MGIQNLASFPGHFCSSVCIILCEKWNKNRERLGMKLPSWSVPTVRDISIDSQPLGALAPIPRLSPQLSVTCSTLHCTVHCHWDGTRPLERSGSVLKVRGNQYQYLLLWEHSVLFSKGQESGQEICTRFFVVNIEHTWVSCEVYFTNTKMTYYEYQLSSILLIFIAMNQQLCSAWIAFMSQKWSVLELVG